MTNLINVFETTVTDYLQVDAHLDGSVVISIDDNVIVEIQLDDPTPNTESIRKALKKALGVVGDALPISIEGKDF